MDKNSQLNPNDNKKIKELYIEMEENQKAIQHTDKQLQNINAKQTEVRHINETLENLKKIESGEELLVPLNNGIFVKAKITEVDNVLVNVGSDIVVKKTIPQTIKMMEKQLEQIKKYQVQMESHIDSINLRNSQIQEEFKNIEKSMEK